MQLSEGVGLSLFFQPEDRPSEADIEQALAGSTQAAQISHREADADEAGWLELVTLGLTFDLHGLAPGGAAPISPVGHVYGLPVDIDRYGFEPVVLVPTAHIAAGAALLPVVRTLLGLAACLARDLPITAVCWNPAQSWMEPKYFGRVVGNWLAGGDFPVLGLTCIKPGKDGVFESKGLAHFIGQELRIPRHRGEPDSDTVMMARHVIDHLIGKGKLAGVVRLSGPRDEALVAEPSADGRHVLVTRAG